MSANVDNSTGWQTKLLWTAVALLGAVAFGIVALNRGEAVNAAWLVVAAVCIYFIAYRFYGLLIADRALGVDGARPTPAFRHNDGLDYVPTNRYVLYGHHFAAIAGAGPLVGPRACGPDGIFARHALDTRRRRVCRRRPGHDGSVPLDPTRRPLAWRHGPRRDGPGRGHDRGHRHSPDLRHRARSACAGRGQGADRQPVGDVRGVLHDSHRLPHGHLQPVHPTRPRRRNVGDRRRAASACTHLRSKRGREPALAAYFNYSGESLALIIIGYGFVASVLPVWLLLAPRDYLSTFLKIGTIALLAVGIIIVRPDLQMPAVTKFIDGTGPVWAGSVFPFLFITIACGAVSGWHSLIASGHHAQDDREREPDRDSSATAAC